MNEHIHTIPVLDALRAAGTCPFCAMKRKLEQDAAGFIIGPAYMEEGVRMETDRLGFCPAHLNKLYAEQNRLGLALMLHTFMRQLNRDTEPGMRKPEPERKPKLAPRLKKAETSCYLCQRVNSTFERYMDTFFYLWQRDSEAQKLIEAAPSYCLPHFTQMLEALPGRLGRADRERFWAVAIKNQRKYMEELEGDIEWFTLKFDYRNEDAPWKNAKDALPRLIKFLTGE